MQAIELNAIVENGTLRLPDLPTTPPDGVVKVIVLWEKETQPQRNYDTEKMEAAFKVVAEKGIFNSITDPVAWQRQLRDEWE